MPHKDGGPGVIWTQECRPKRWSAEQGGNGTPSEPGFSVPQQFQTNPHPTSCFRDGGKQALGDFREKLPLTQIMYLMILLVATVYSSISSAR